MHGEVADRAHIEGWIGAHVDDRHVHALRKQEHLLETGWHEGVLVRDGFQGGATVHEADLSDQRGEGARLCIAGAAFDHGERSAGEIKASADIAATLFEQRIDVRHRSGIGNEASNVQRIGMVHQGVDRIVAGRGNGEFRRGRSSDQCHSRIAGEQMDDRISRG